MSIITVGFSCFDQFFFSDLFLKENTKGVATDYLESGGGPAANAAYLLGLWGESVFHAGHVGKDYYAKKIISQLQEVNVDTSLMIESDDMITPLANIIVNTSTGSRTLLVRKQDAPPKLELLLIPEHINCHAILLDGHEEELSLELVKKFPNSPVVMDAGSVRNSVLNLAKYTDYFVASEPFALKYCGLDFFENKRQIFDVILKIAQICKGQVFITLGDKGCAYIPEVVNLGTIRSKKSIYSLPKVESLRIVSPYKCNALDSTGAGDIFHGAFTYGVSKKWPIEKIIDFSNKTAAISVEKKGVRASMPSLSDVESCNFIKVNE